jgi:16S rRNA (guanine527-N7)-methyltransferase
LNEIVPEPDAQPLQQPKLEPPALNDDTLAAALARHAIEVDEVQLAELERYCQALWDWNSRINLTRHTSYEKFVARDVMDSAVLERLLDAGQRVLDVGSGGGVPGALLAILRPDLEVTLTESVAKKARALEEIVRAAKVNATVRHCRAEELLAVETFDSIVVRAVAPLAKLLTWFEPHWNSFERLLVIKGPAWVEERRGARERGLLRGLELRKAANYPLVGADGESVILSIRPKDSETAESQ